MTECQKRKKTNNIAQSQHDILYTFCFPNLLQQNCEKQYITSTPQKIFCYIVRDTHCAFLKKVLALNDDVNVYKTFVRFYCQLEAFLNVCVGTDSDPAAIVLLVHEFERL
mmetsp:Transcript_32024/g.51784  ORF Transcript_32024/g.51784 Transcript_32024/m.51784 type:complete len:110 (-) Transcript_32024:258-587(-)